MYLFTHSYINIALFVLLKHFKMRVCPAHYSAARAANSLQKAWKLSRVLLLSHVSTGCPRETSQQTLWIQKLPGASAAAAEQKATSASWPCSCSHLTLHRCMLGGQTTAAFPWWCQRKDSPFLTVGGLSDSPSFWLLVLWCNCLTAAEVTQYFPGERPKKDCILTPPPPPILWSKTYRCLWKVLENVPRKN